MKSIGIDLGTTSISVNVVSFPGLTVWGKETLEMGGFLESPHSWERAQDPKSVLFRVRQVLDSLLDQCPDVAAIGLTGQMHGILYVDGEGNALSPLYTWQDGRGGLPLSQGKSACQLLGEKGARCAPGYGMGTHLYNLKMACAPRGPRASAPWRTGWQWPSPAGNVPCSTRAKRRPWASITAPPALFRRRSPGLWG